MDLIDRLKYYKSQNLAAVKNDSSKKYSDSVATSLNGITLSDGVIKIESIFPLHLHYPEQIFPEELTQVSVPLLTRGVFSSHIELNRVVFFDLETTGLAGGTGTYPFLQAYGILENNELRVFQYFLSDFGCEVPAYTDLAKLISGKDMLISYNGKTFDYPLLKNRFILNRYDNPFEGFEHLDLLHLARRAWRNHLDGFSMPTIEQKIFLFSRWRDIDGWMIPQAYFEFIRNGKTDDIQRIITHNQQDIVSLARLLIHLHMMENTGYRQHNTPVELENLCHQAVKKGDLSAVRILIRQCEIRSININPALKAEISLLFKRNSFWDNAVALWNELIQSENHFVFALEELAKYHEHQRRDYKMAMQYTSRALEILQLMREISASGADKSSAERFQIRLNRLSRKSGYNPLT